MKILAIVNVSNNDDLICDSGVILQRILAKHFTKHDVNYHVVVSHSALGIGDLFGDVTLHRAALGTTRYGSRFTFPLGRAGLFYSARI